MKNFADILVEEDNKNQARNYADYLVAEDSFPSFQKQISDLKNSKDINAYQNAFAELPKFKGFIDDKSYNSLYNGLSESINQLNKVKKYKDDITFAVMKAMDNDTLTYKDLNELQEIRSKNPEAVDIDTISLVQRYLLGENVGYFSTKVETLKNEYKNAKESGDEKNAEKLNSAIERKDKAIAIRNAKYLKEKAEEDEKDPFPKFTKFYNAFDSSTLKDFYYSNFKNPVPYFTVDDIRKKIKNGEKITVAEAKLVCSDLNKNEYFDTVISQQEWIEYFINNKLLNDPLVKLAYDQYMDKYYEYNPQEFFRANSYVGAKAANEAIGTQYEIDALAADDLDKYTEIGEASATKAEQEDTEFMTLTQKSVYYYYIGKGQNQEAYKYSKAIADDLNYKEAQSLVSDAGPIKKTGISFAAGLEDFGKDIVSFSLMLSDNNIGFPANKRFDMDLKASLATESALSYAAAEIIEGSGTWGKVWYSAARSIGRQTPMLVLSAAAPQMGLSSKATELVTQSLMFISSSGGAYLNEMKNNKSENQASVYAAINGTLEVGMEKLLGGVYKWSGGSKLASTVLGKMQNALKSKGLSDITMGILGVATYKLAIMGSEGFEEYLQEIVDPMVRNFVYEEDNEVPIYTDEAFISYLSGALVSFLLGWGDIRSTYRQSLTGSSIRSNTDGINGLITNADNMLNNADVSTDIKETISDLLETVKTKQNKSTNIELGQLQEAVQIAAQEVIGKNVEQIHNDLKSNIAEISQVNKTAEDLANVESIDDLLKNKLKSSGNNAENISTDTAFDTNAKNSNDKITNATPQPETAGEEVIRYLDAQQGKTANEQTVQPTSTATNVDISQQQNNHQTEKGGSVFREPNLRERSDVTAGDEIVSMMDGEKFAKTNEHRRCERVAEKLGMPVEWYAGAADENGYYQNGTIYLNINSPEPFMFIFKHEFTHHLESSKWYNEFVSYVEGTELYLNWIANKGGETAYANIIKSDYAKAGKACDVQHEIIANFVGEKLLGGKGGLSIGADGEIVNTDIMVERELYKFAKEKPTIFGSIIDHIRTIIAKLRQHFGKTSGINGAKEIDAMYSYLVHMKETANKNTANDSGVEYSIVYTTDNKPVAVIDEDILDGVPKSQWIQTVKDTILKKFSDGIPISGRLIKVNQKTRNEFTNSKNSQWYAKNNQVMYADKFKSANNLDDIVLASTNYINEDLKHNRNDKFTEFARGDVLIRVGKTDYSAKVIVGFTSGKQMVLYDVIDFSPASFEIKKTDMRSPSNRINAENGSNISVSNPNIPQGDTVVNNYSMQNRTKNTIENEKKFSVSHNNGSNGGNEYSVDKQSQTSDNVSRANKQGELINEFYDALDKNEWRTFYKKIANNGFLEKTEVGDRVAIAIGGKLVIADRQLRGNSAHDFQVVAAYQESSGDSFITNEIADLINESEDAYDQRRIESTIVRLGKKIDATAVLNRYDREYRKFVNNAYKRADGSSSTATYGSDSGRTYGTGVSSSTKQNTQRINADLNESAFSMPENEKQFSISNNKAKQNNGITAVAEHNQVGAFNRGYTEFDADGNEMTNEQSRFFSNSKVRDENGNLLVVYHGTGNGNFNVFDRSKQGSTDSGVWGRGFYFDIDSEIANDYGEYVRPFYLNITNPYIINEFSESAEKTAAYLQSNGYDVDFDYHGMDLLQFIKKIGNQKFSDILQNLGHDGVIIGNAEFVVYDESQIKLTNNQNPTNDQDIRYSIGSTGESTQFADKVNALSAQLTEGVISEDEYRHQLQNILDEANDKYGTIPKGENSVVDVRVPKRVSNDKNTRRHVRTILETGKMNNEMTATVYKDILKDTLSYVPVSDKGAMNHANQQLKSGRALGIWEATVNGTGKINKNAIACGEALLRMEAEAGNTQHVMQLIAELSEVATRAGQTVQAFSLLKKMDGIGQLYYIQKCVNRLNQDLEKKNKNSFEPVTINEELAIELANAKPGQETEAVADMIMDDIAEQVPSTFLDKWNAWRYLSMLGNPKTHIRNIVGNAVFVPAVKIKDTIKAGIENAAMPKDQRTASVIIGKEYKDFAKNDFKEVEDIITGNGKMNPSDAVKERQKIFENRLLENIRKYNFDMLEKEDSIFLKMHYVRALGGFLQARGIDLNSITNEQLNEARNYAILEAQKATYRDACALANTISKASKANFAADILIEGVLPFKKTPINIIKRGLEYSPIGTLKTLTKGTYDLKSGKITASQYIDGLSSGLTGTGLFAVGAILSSLGVAIGGLGYDDDDALKRLNGEQEYSIELFGKSYTVDWMAPACIPFFMGVEFMNMFDDSDKSFAAAFVDAGYGSLEPIINLSMLDGIRDTIAAAKYSDDENVFTSILGEVVKSYAGQALPTIAGQIARTFDSTRRSTYVSSDATGFEKAVQQFLQSSVQGKVPGWENMKQEYTNAFGEADENTSFFARLIENMISPGYMSSVKKTDITRQLEELYNNTGETGIIPKKAPKSIYIGNGERKYLNADEYTKFNRAKGEYSKQLLSDLFESSAYKRMVYEQKAIAVKEAYAYALALAKSEVSDYELKNPYKSWKEYQDRGINIVDLIALKVTDMDADGSGSVSKEEYAEAVSNTDMSDAEKELLIGINDNKNKSDYKAKKIGAFKEGKWFKKEGGKYVEITSSKELVELRRNGITTYELTNAKTSAIEEMWRIFEENNK